MEIRIMAVNPVSIVTLVPGYLCTGVQSLRKKRFRRGSQN